MRSVVVRTMGTFWTSAGEHGVIEDVDSKCRLPQGAFPCLDGPLHTATLHVIVRLQYTLPAGAERTPALISNRSTRCTSDGIS